MTSSRFILQAITPDNHLECLRSLFSLPNPSRFLVSTAFMTSGGISLIETNLRTHAAVSTIFVGIRNGITSSQGLQKALDFGCRIYVVDTGSSNILFHPKIYLSRNSIEAHVMIGSANLTAGGMNNNIEASFLLRLDLSITQNQLLIADIEDKLMALPSGFPQHVLEVMGPSMIADLLAAGRVIDESIAPPPEPAGASRNRDLDTTPRMPLQTRPLRRQRSIVRTPRPTAISPAGGAATVPTSPTPVMRTRRDHLLLVWESRPLTERYLTIPSGSTTNPTGSMLFTKGTLEGIDQRSYFRDVVFGSLMWSFDTAPSSSHLERAEARFGIIIKDIDYGVYTLRLTHNTRTDTRTYEQRNSMTLLHWGAARPLIARRDLLGRTLSLYRNEDESDYFVLTFV